MQFTLWMKSFSWIIIIAGIELHSVFCFTGFTNFARNKNASQSSTYKDWTADKAVNGNSSLPCSATSKVENGNHTWEVDIGFEVIVKNIIVYPRTDQGDNQLFGFALYIGNESNSWIGNRSRKIPSPIPSPRSSPYRFEPIDSVARFISVARLNKEIMTICEVKVHGECLDGVYSAFCNMTCGHCYGDHPCNKTTGKCTGCGPGWKGEKCVIECDNGTYGYGCNETCGSCHGGNQSCSMRNGYCPYGCIQGWQGNTCKQECKNGTYGHGCNETCGMCITGNDSCALTDGHCINGCEPGWQGQTCKTKKRPLESYSQVNMIVSVVLVTVVIVALTVIFAFAVVIKRRRLRKDKEDQFDKVKEKEQILDTLSKDKRISYLKIENEEDFEKTSDLSGGVYQNAEKMNLFRSHGIPVLKFWDHVMTKKANKDLLTSEFHEINEGLNKKHDVALANSSKNRYRHVYPYDFNRVVLKRDLSQSTDSLNESDYINASHIKGERSRRTYIACQGPTENTLCDFWWMIWQEKTECIIMLTNLVEIGKVKCKQYWPEEGEQVYGSVKVKLVRVEVWPDYVKRNLDITVGESTRRLAQFHYDTWPDKDVPDTAWSLVGFWKDVCKRNIYGEGPLVVHCSAGVGRTGTFIAFDIIYNEVCETGHASIKRCVDTLREQRVNMVQTANQYMFLHEVVAESLGFGTMPVFQKQFVEVFRHLMEKDKHSGITLLERQYKLLSNADRGNDESGLQTYSNISCFHSENIRLPNLSGIDAYIVSKWSGDEQSLANIRLYKVKTVINIDSEDPKDSWFSLDLNVPRIVHGFTVTCKGKEDFDALERKQFTITNSNTTETSHITVILVKSWQGSRDAPSDIGSISALLDNVNQWHPSPTESDSILIYSRYEINRCSVIYTLLAEKDRIQRDGKIHILQTSADMLARSVILLPTFEQYVFLHKCLLSHATMEFAYENTASLNKLKEIL